MDYFRVKSWERFQHYKRRNPPWIKLYTSLLDDYDFGCLHDASKLLALCILMLAAKTGNKLPIDEAWLHKKTGLDQMPDLSPLFDCGFIVRIEASVPPAPCKQSATPEKRQTETDIHTEESDFKKTMKAAIGRVSGGRA